MGRRFSERAAKICVAGRGCRGRVSESGRGEAEMNKFDGIGVQRAWMRLTVGDGRRRGGKAKGKVDRKVRWCGECGEYEEGEEGE